MTILEYLQDLDRDDRAARVGCRSESDCPNKLWNAVTALTVAAP